MNMKRVFFFMLAFIMVLGMVPTAFAAETELTGLTVNGLSVTHSETMTWAYDELVSYAPAGGSITCQASKGNEIVVVATPGNVAQAGATLTFKNDLSISATLSFRYTYSHVEDDYAELRDSNGVIDNSGTIEMELDAGATYTITVISPDCGYNSATLTISELSLSTGGDVTATFKPASNGTYTVEGEQITADKAYTADAGASYTVAATAASGYRFFGWYDGTEYLSHKAETAITVTKDQTIQPVFIQDTVAVFGVGEKRFQSLTEADAYAKNGIVKTIVLMNDGILTGEHTVSAGNTLLIPYDDANSVHTVATSTSYQDGSYWVKVDWVQPSAYRTLTMAQGAKITVQGSLNVGGRHCASPFLAAGSPTDALGMIQMAEGSNITVASGGVLYCWGYIYGNGTVTVKDGGAAHENFQFSDFRGGNATLQLAQDFLVFPMSQYYVQNVEVAATFECGATEYVWGSIYIQNMVYGTSVKFIGDNPNLCMFVPGAGGTVTKTYDPSTDRLIIDINGDGSINPMGLELADNTINTKDFVLPINSNMTININSGTTYINQSLALLPGVKLTVAKDAVLSLKQTTPLKDENGVYVHYVGANNLIVYDRDQWFKAYDFVYSENQITGITPIEEAYFVYTNVGRKRLQPVAYSPTRSYTRTEANLVDAVVDINGKLITDGYIYTTVDIDLQGLMATGVPTITGGGASVTSTKGTGVLVMNNGSGPDNITLQPIQEDEISYAEILMLSARLQNRDGSYTDTFGAASGATYQFCENCGEWYLSNNASHSVEISWIVEGVANGEAVPQEVCVDTKPVYNSGTDPVKEGCEFIGWSTDNDNVPEYTSATLPNATVEATYWACFEEKAQVGLLGDFNDDGEVDANDLTLLARHVGKIELLSGQALKNADVDGDGDVDANDLTKHARYVGKIITDWSQD